MCALRAELKLLGILQADRFRLGRHRNSEFKKLHDAPLTKAGRFTRAAFYYFFAVKNNLGIFRMTFPSP